MKITNEWLNKKKACDEGLKWFENQTETDGIMLVKKLSETHLNWANWLVTCLMDQKKCVQYAVYAAELVLPIFEGAYPDDKRPRLAIEAAKSWLENPTLENAATYAAAADAATNAARAADAADGARAAYAAYAENGEKIIDFGIKIIEQGEN